MVHHIILTKEYSFEKSVIPMKTIIKMKKSSLFYMEMVELLMNLDLFAMNTALFNNCKNLH